MLTKATWSDLELVVRGLTHREIGPPVSGQLLIENNILLQALLACLGSSDTDTRMHLVNGESPNALSVGQTVEVELAPRFGFGILTKDVNTLLNAQSARVKEPARFLLLDELISQKDVVAEEHLLARYRAVLAFIQMLKRAAAFLDTDEQNLVFIKEGKFEIPIEYDVEDLNSLSLSTLKEVSTILPTGTHEKQCFSIMAEAVIDMTKHLPSYSRFRHLLTHLIDLKKRYEDGYKLFASGFSYEKVRDQVEAARVEYAAKIHKVFSDIQNQLLSIPIATVIVATQMKDATKIGYEFWVNTSVLMGCWVFAVLMLFLLYNQSHTLAVVETEIDRQKRQLEKEYASVASSISATFVYLKQRADTQYRILWAIGVIVGLGLFLAHVVFFKLTIPARSWLIGLFPSLGNYF